MGMPAAAEGAPSPCCPRAAGQTTRANPRAATEKIDPSLEIPDSRDSDRGRRTNIDFSFEDIRTLEELVAASVAGGSILCLTPTSYLKRFTLGKENTLVQILEAQNPRRVAITASSLKLAAPVEAIISVSNSISDVRPERQST
jgi:hypothetical protein